MSLTIRLLETFSESELVIPVGTGVRLPLSGIAHRALAAESAESEFVIDDPGAGFTISDIAGLRGIRFEDDADLDANIIFAGNFTKRVTQRGDSDRVSLITDSDRQWTVSVVDDNWQLRRRVIHNSDGIRPAETDVERMQWYIASAYSFNIDDDSLVDTTNPVPMDPVDYTGKFGIDVVNDCMKVSGKNAFIYPLQDGTGHHGIAYFLATSTTYSSDLQISNDPSDWSDLSLEFDAAAMDSWTVFPCGADAQQTLDPERLFNGVFMRWSGGSLYLQDATTAEIYGNRDISVDEPNVKTAAAASALAQKYLDVSGFEESIVNVAAVLPASKVNAILAGQRISVKLRHLPGLEDFTWRRISQRGVSQYQQRRDLYLVNLELRDPRLVGGIGTGSVTVPAGTTNGQTPPPAGSGPTLVQTYGPSSDIDFIAWDSTPAPGDLVVAVITDTGVTDEAGFVAGAETEGWTVGVVVVNSGVMCAVLWRIVQTGDTGDYGLFDARGIAYELSSASGWETDPITASATNHNTSGDGDTALTVTLPSAPATAFTVAVLTDNDGNTPGATMTGTTAGWTQIGTDMTGGGSGLHATSRFLKDGSGVAAATGVYGFGGSGAFLWAAATAAIGGSGGTGGSTTLAAGQPNARPEVVTMSGASGTTAHPFADGTLRVYVDNLDQTAAITSQDGTTGDFTLAFTPTSSEQVTVEYLGRGTG